jgi:hypothetical protein
MTVSGPVKSTASQSNLYYSQIYCDSAAAELVQNVGNGHDWENVKALTTTNRGD